MATTTLLLACAEPGEPALERFREVSILERDQRNCHPSDGHRGRLRHLAARRPLPQRLLGAAMHYLRLFAFKLAGVSRLAATR